MTAGAVCRIVIPCYNEEQRLEPARVTELLEAANCTVLLVNDGSTDNTGSLLASLAATDERISVLTLAKNCGKAEAVRQGLQGALATGADLVGFADADFATPPSEIARLVQICRETDRRVVFGARVALLGHDIERGLFRHYTGRLFATCSSLVLGFDVYDTQCGAKLFAATTQLHSALAQPFVGRWSFDVELLGRLAAADGTEGFLEVPLLHWREIGGSKLGMSDSIRSTAELWSVRRRLRKFRAGVGSAAGHR